MAVFRDFFKLVIAKYHLLYSAFIDKYFLATVMCLQSYEIIFIPTAKLDSL
jgi:hypothetical protein